MNRAPLLLIAGLGLLASPAPALAYMGPGIGLGAASTALSILGALVLGLISILWYPAKRLVRRLRGRSQ
jgi:hypothetical protein